jgi:hypothetical protein
LKSWKEGDEQASERRRRGEAFGLGWLATRHLHEGREAAEAQRHVAHESCGCDAALASHMLVLDGVILGIAAGRASIASARRSASGSSNCSID